MPEKLGLCKCGCGMRVRRGNKLAGKGCGFRLYNKSRNYFGESNPFYKRKHTEETKEKIRQKLKKVVVPRVLCSCGCGVHAKQGKKFLQGHNLRVNNPMKHPENVAKWKQSCPSREGRNNSFYGRKHSEITRKKMSDARKRKYCGKNHPMYGRTPSVRAGYGIRSFCKNCHWVRSTWERKVADWLFDNGIEYEYELIRFEFNEYCSYCPDFYLPVYDLYIEVKGYMTDKNVLQHFMFRKMEHKLVVIGNKNKDRRVDVDYKDFEVGLDCLLL